MASKIFASALSKNRDWKQAVEELSSILKGRFSGKPCDLLIFFVSESYKNFDTHSFTDHLSKMLPAGVMIGCNSSGVIGDSQEIEMEPAISVMAMQLPGVKLHPMRISSQDLESIESGNDLLHFLDVYPPNNPRFICLADPMSCDVTKFLQAFNQAFKDTPVIGGLASGRVMGASNWICLNGEVHTEGIVGVALVGDIEFETLVSQGCRPVGEPFVITKAEGNVLYELAGRQALEVVQELLESLSSKERKLAEKTLSAGLVMNEQQAHFKRGDFLVRNLIGADYETGALMIGENLRVGQTLQFQVRDSGTSAEDLEILLKKLNGSATSDPKGGFLVSCCGRGRSFYGNPDHDVQMIQSIRGPLPLTGFFASGEIGPVGSKNYVHGYTSSLVIFK